MSFFKTLLLILLMLLSPVRMLAFEMIADLDRLEKHRHVLALEWKTYRISSDESIALYGAKEKKFFTENWYWGESGYGAVSGKRSGYLEGGLIVGSEYRVGDFLTDFRLFTGAGGGGDAPQGGGFIVHVTAGLGLPINRQLFFLAELGYISFLNGDIESPTFGFSLNTNFWALGASS